MSSPRQSWPRKTDEKNDLLLSAMKKAWEAGFTAGFTGDFGDDVEFGSAFLEEKMADIDFWLYDVRKDPSSEKKGTRAPKTPSPKKPTGDPAELAKLPFDSSKCRARKFNKGYPLQCWKIPTDGEDVCHLCMARRDDDSQDFWGYFDEPLVDCCLNKDGKPHAWKELASSRAEKKESDKKEKKLAKEKAKEKAKEEKEAAKAAKKAEQEKKKRLKDLKKKAKAEEKAKANVAKKKEEVAAVEVEDPVAEVEEPVAEVKEPVAEVEEPVAEVEEPVAEQPPEEAKDQDEDELDEDTQSIGDSEEVFEEYVHDGYSMKWNKITNDLLDPDDDEVLGRMVFDDEGNPKAEINVDDSDDSDEEE